MLPDTKPMSLSQLVGNGQRVPNEGQLHLNIEYQGISLRSVFQIAKIIRPLMTVGRVCDQGFKCTFDSKEALIVGPNNAVVCKFERKNGLYVAKLRLKSPELFARQAR